MPAQLTNEEIFQGVREVLADEFGLDLGDITREATLIRDLGAESIDFIDMDFRLEKHFGIKIPRDEIYPRHLTEFVSSGRFTEEGIALIKRHMRWTNLTPFLKDPTVTKFADIYTVQLLCDYIASKLSCAGL